MSDLLQSEADLLSCDPKLLVDERERMNLSTGHPTWIAGRRIVVFDLDRGMGGVGGTYEACGDGSQNRWRRVDGAELSFAGDFLNWSWAWAPAYTEEPMLNAVYEDRVQ